MTLTPEHNAGAAESGTVYTMISYNIGFGAYESDYGFFMDGGTESRAWSKERLTKNLTAISTFLGIVVIRPLIAFLLVFVIKLDLIGIWIALISDALLCYGLAKWRWKSGKWAMIRV